MNILFLTEPTFLPASVWTYLIQQVPALGILIYFGWKSLNSQDNNLNWIKGQLEKKESELNAKDTDIQKLNDYIRQSEKENLEMLNEMNSVIDQMVNNIRIMNDKVLGELDKKILDLKNHIQDRLMLLENNIKNNK